MTTTPTFAPGTVVTGDGVDVPLTALEAHGAVTGLFATWKLLQHYRNPTDETVEITYTFPLPGRFAAHTFTYTTDGRRVTGELRERREARADYDAAVASGQQAALVEEDRPEVFTVTLGNLPAGADAVVELELTGPVPVVAGEADLRLPTIVGERYIDGTPTGTSHGYGTVADTDRTPDASRVTPPAGDVRVPYTLEVTLDSVEQPRVSRGLAAAGATGAWTVRSDDGFVPDGDLHVRFAATGDAAEPAAVAAADDSGVTVAVTFAPPAPEHARPRDVVVVVDRSGSMAWSSRSGGEANSSMDIAARAAGRLVDSFGEDDRIGVISFDTSIEAWRDELVAATDDNRFGALTFCSNLTARGGTDLAGAIRRAVTLVGNSRDRDRMIIVITDALVGAEDATLRCVPTGITTHAIAIGGRANQGLLARVTGVGGGAVVAVETGAELDRALTALRRLSTAPVLRDVTIAVDGDALDELSPRCTDIHHGVANVISGRCATTPAAVTVSGVEPGGRQVTWTVPVTATDNAAVHATWARARVRDLEDLRVIGGESAPNAETIVAHSLAHQVLCRFTAFVAVDDDGAAVEPASRTLVTPVPAMTLNSMSVQGLGLSGTVLRSAKHGNYAGGAGLNSSLSAGTGLSHSLTTNVSEGISAPSGSIDGWSTWKETTAVGGLLSGPLATPKSDRDRLAELCSLILSLSASTDVAGEIAAIAMRFTVAGEPDELVTAAMDLSLVLRSGASRSDINAAASAVAGLLARHRRTGVGVVTAPAFTSTPADARGSSVFWDVPT